jgi:D-amino-acid dehydrogenase
MRIIVIGAGIAGVATAFELARDGHEVTVVERREDVALETSFANAGMLTPSQAPPWNEPGIARQALRFLFETEAALVVPLRLDLARFRWLAQFLRNSAPRLHAAHSQAILALARHSRTRMDALAAEHSIAFDRTRAGVLTLVRDAGDMAAAESAAASLRALGTAARLVDREATLAMEPALQPIADAVTGSIYTEEDHSGDIHAFTVALADAGRRLGVSYRLGENVQRLDRAGDRIAAVVTARARLDADAVVVAAGSHSPAVVRDVGIRLPIYPVQGCSLTYSVPDWEHLPSRPVRDRKLKVAITPLGRRIRVTGMAILDGYRADIEPRYLDRMRRTIRTIFPTLPGDAPERAWSGLRPMTPDGPPIIGRTPIANLFLNTGHGPLGWTLGCGAACLLADLVAGRRSAVDPGPFDVARYR